MRKGTSKTIILIISMIILVAVIGIILYFTLSKDGAVTKIVEDEKTYNNVEVVEEINLTIRKKYIEIYTYSVENKVALADIYNSDIVLEKIEEDGLIEKYTEIKEDGSKKTVENKFYIVVPNLKMDITSGKGANGSDKDIFIIEKNLETGEHIVKYYDNKGEVQDVGKLNFTPEV